MEMLLKAVACVLISVVLCHTIPKERKDFSLLLSVAVSCLVFIAALTYLKPVITFFSHLQTLCGLNTEMMNVMLKAVGIGLIAEIATLICKDVGNGALGKSLQILATATILYLTLPLFNELITLVEKVLGAV